MALSGSSTGWSFNNTLFYTFKGKVSSLVLQCVFAHSDVLVVNTRNTYCLGKNERENKGGNSVYHKVNGKLTWDVAAFIVIHPAAASEQSFSCSRCVSDAKIRAVTEEPERGSRKEIDTFLIIVVYKSFPFWFTELVENDLLEESLYHSLVEQSPTGCDPAMPPLSAPLSFLRYASRRWQKVRGLEDRTQMQRVAAERLWLCSYSLAHVPLAWPGVILPGWSTQGLCGGCHSSFLSWALRLPSLGNQGASILGACRVSLSNGNRFGQGSRRPRGRKVILV